MTVHDQTAAYIPVIIIGGGQAGLSVSWYLTRDGIGHIVFERHKRFQSWRVNRWDSFCLVTPNWQCRLPGYPYQGVDPDGFMRRKDIVDYLNGFSASFDPPLRDGGSVTRVTPLAGAGYRVETTAGVWTCGQVVVATGGYDQPIVPPYASAIAPEVVQRHSAHYRRPAQVPDGGTLIVGTGQSGVQIMEDFHRAGREVHLAVGRAPRKYRGRDATDWLHDMGQYAITIDKHPDPIKAPTQTNPYMSGRDGGKEIDLRRFALEGVHFYGSLSGAQGTVLQFLPDLERNLDDADRSYCAIRDQIDAWIAAQGIDAPVEQCRLGMAACGWRGLSEGWLLRHLGDVHWRQIAAAMGQQAAVFHDASGAPVYAAFCAISERFLRPELAQPGAVLTITSRLRRLSATRLSSFHHLDINGLAFAEGTLITAFVRHGTGGNAQIQRTQPCGVLDLPLMEPGEDAGFAKEATRLYRTAESESPAAVADVTPCPTTDFNAAGLLYCANYPALADRAEWALCPAQARGLLTLRKIVYLGNVDEGVPVTASLRRDGESPARHHVTRASQGRAIARIITEKQS